MISFDDILALHEMSIADYGGSKGLRDKGLLESAIA
jgi:prophage maintenance system killer protein